MAEERILRVGVQTDQAEQNLDQLNRKFISTGLAAEQTGRAASTLGKHFRGLVTEARQLGQMFLSLTGGLTFGLAIKAALDLDKQLDKLRAVGGATREEMVLFNGELRKLSETVGKPQTELAESLIVIKQAGFDGAEAMEVLTAASQAAATGLGDTKVIADAVTSAMQAYGPAVLSAEKATSILLLTAREGKVSMDQFEAGMGKILPTAANLGVSFAQLSATIAAMSRVGIDGKLATGALAAILDTLGSPTDAAGKALDKANISITNLQKTLRQDGIIAAMLELKKGIGDNEDALNQIFPNIRGLNALLSVVGTRAEEATRIVADLSKETGDTLGKAFAEVTDESLAYDNAMQKLKNQMVDFGAEALPVVTTAVGYLASGFTALKEAIQGAAESFARLITGLNADLFDALTAKVRATEAELAKLERERRIKFSLAGFDTSAAGKALDEAIAEAEKKLASFRSSQKDEAKQSFAELDKAIGTQSIESFRKIQEALIAAYSPPPGFVGFSAAFADQAPLIAAQRNLALLDAGADDFVTHHMRRIEDLQAANERLDFAVSFRPQQFDRAALEPEPEVKKPPVGAGTGIKDDEAQKIRDLVDKYDEFNSKVSDLTKNFKQLQIGVAAGTISAAESRNAYNGMVEDIAKAAATSKDFDIALTQSQRAIQLLNSAVDEHGLKLTAQAAAYREIISGLVSAAAASGDFSTTVSDSAKASGFIAKSVREIGLSSQFAAEGMEALFSQMADSALAAGTYKEAVAQANVVLDTMVLAVQSGLLPQELAVRRYNEMGAALIKLNPNIVKLTQEQNNWNTLLSNSVTPLETYQSKMTELSRVTQELLVSAPSRQTEILKNFFEGTAQAADAYAASLAQLTPAQEKIKGAIDRVAEASATGFSNMIQNVSSLNDVFNGLLKTITDVILQLLVLEPLRNSITSGISSFFSLGIGGGGGGAASGGAVSRIPAFAGGGYLPFNQKAFVGEEGPELFLPFSKTEDISIVGRKGPELFVAPEGGGQIISNRETRNIITNNTTSIYGRSVSPQQIATISRANPFSETSKSADTILAREINNTTNNSVVDRETKRLVTNNRETNRIVEGSALTINNREVNNVIEGRSPVVGQLNIFKKERERVPEESVTDKATLFEEKVEPALSATPQAAISNREVNNVINNNRTEGDIIRNITNRTDGDVIRNITNRTEGDVIRNITNRTDGDVIRNITNRTEGDVIRNITNRTEGDVIRNITNRTEGDAINNITNRTINNITNNNGSSGRIVDDRLLEQKALMTTLLKSLQNELDKDEKRAGGGFMRSGLRAVVGEEGPELFIPSDPTLEPTLLGKEGPSLFDAPEGGGIVISNRETRNIIEGRTTIKTRIKDEFIHRTTTKYRVGEEGAELFIPKTTGSVAKIVGKSGPEMMAAPDSGGIILSNRATRKILDLYSGKRSQEAPGRAGGGGVVSKSGTVPLFYNNIMEPSDVESRRKAPQKAAVINVHNYSGSEATVQRRQSAGGDDIYDIIVGAVTRNIDNHGSVSKAMNRTNRLVRR